MDDSPFKNREIIEMIEASNKRSDTFHDTLMQRMDDFEKNTSGSLERIETQTKKTNGSVAEINRWRERANGAGLASGIFMTLVVLPILGWALYVLSTVNGQVHQAVDQALSAYSINK